MPVAALHPPLFPPQSKLGMNRSTIRLENFPGGCRLPFILMGILGAILACSNPACSDSMEEKEMSFKAIQKALETHNQELLSTPGVVGTAQSLCDGDPCIQVMVSKKSPSLERKILSILEGYPVRIEETGAIRPRPPK